MTNARDISNVIAARAARTVTGSIYEKPVKPRSLGRVFGSRDQQRVYDSMVNRDEVEKIGPLGHSYYAGRDWHAKGHTRGNRGINFGIRGSLMRAAWWAGYDRARRDKKATTAQPR